MHMVITTTWINLCERQQGRQEGRQEVRQEGAEEKAIAMAQAMLKAEEPIEKIMLYTCLSEESIRRLKPVQL